MKDFCIVYSKSNKAFVKKLAARLEADSVSCMVAPRDFKQENKDSLEKAVVNSNVLLMIIDNESGKDLEMTNALEFALENEKSVIPYVISKIKSDLYSEYFLYSFSWVDGYEDSFDDAYEILIGAYEDLSGEDAQDRKKKKKNKSKNAENNWLNNKPLMAVLGLFVFGLVAYFAYSYFSNEQRSQQLVGEWNLVDYQDNLRRQPADSIEFVTQTLPNLKKQVLLIFNDDNTFERIGFSPEPQIGKWKFNSDKSTLQLIPYGATASADELQIRNISKNSFTIVAEEELQDSVQTKSGAYRQITTNSVTKIKFRRK